MKDFLLACFKMRPTIHYHPYGTLATIFCFVFVFLFLFLFLPLRRTVWKLWAKGAQELVVAGQLGLDGRKRQVLHCRLWKVSLG
jgi:hypothetical protein